MNLNNSFHKNANGEKIRGNRVNIYCVDEAIMSGQDFRYMRAYKLPYKNVFTNPNNFLEALEQMLKYTHVKDYQNDLNLKVEQTSLNI